jgi:hypothetical protein
VQKFDIVRVQKGTDGRDYFKNVGLVIVGTAPGKKSAGKVYLHMFEGEFLLFHQRGQQQDAHGGSDRGDPHPPWPAEPPAGPPSEDDMPF